MKLFFGVFFGLYYFLFSVAFQSTLPPKKGLLLPGNHYADIPGINLIKWQQKEQLWSFAKVPSTKHTKITNFSQGHSFFIYSVNGFAGSCWLLNYAVGSSEKTWPLHVRNCWLLNKDENISILTIPKQNVLAFHFEMVFHFGIYLIKKATTHGEKDPENNLKLKENKNKFWF